MSAEHLDEDSLLARRAIIVALVAGVALGGGIWLKKHRSHRGHASKPAAGALAPSSSAGPAASIAVPVTTDDPPGLAIELWLKSPEALAARIAPRLPVKMAPPPYMPQLIVGGFPKELHADLAVLDFDKPLGVLLLDGDKGLRNVVAIAVKDTATAPQHLAHFADGVKAT
ncbi:MAG: hypothetical protein IPJ34_40095, partial [Myxococcales bacterium]|nr:hypothetical protein [Myxococcales bacterium]